MVPSDDNCSSDSSYCASSGFFTLRKSSYQLCQPILAGPLTFWRQKQTGLIVSVFKRTDHVTREISTLMEMMCRHFDKYHIVKFYGLFDTDRKALVFEMLHIDLCQHLTNNMCKPMLLSDIRVIIQQMAKALEALKRTGIIHSTLNTDNIKMVDDRTRPFRVKLTDFSLSMLRSEVTQGPDMQYCCFRSPERILGLPFSEAIDMWSLGCVMLVLICGYKPDVHTEQDMVAFIVQVLGQPADHLLNDGTKAKEFFTKRHSNQWRQKRPKKNILRGFIFRLPNGRKVRSLDDLKTMRLESDNKAEAEDREQCIELLKAMLEIDPNKRITPSEVLTHPFIDCISYPWTREYLECSATEISLDFRDFEIMGKLGSGSYGEMRKCRNNHTGETVAVKRPLDVGDCENEVARLEDLMHLNLGRSTIVRLHGWFNFSIGKAPVFEMLDMSLHDFINESGCEPMLLSDIRVVIQQMAKALEVLRIKGIIHGDIKPDNVMIVDHQKRPLEVKLIDFGFAMHRSEAKQGMMLQVTFLRAPEIFFGMPFSEAIDMSSLGWFMSWMINGSPLFEANCAIAMVAFIVQFLGQPADNLLDNGQWANEYFTKTRSNHWRHQRPKMNLAKYISSLPNGRKLQSLDDLKKMLLESDNKAEAEEREQCIELLKAMLEIDPNKRIIPSEVLTHPFIDCTKYSDSTTILQPGVESPDSLQTGLNKTTEKASICEDSTTGDANETQTEKKKNCFLRIFSRIKILDRHPAPEKTQGMVDVENPDRLQTGLNKTTTKASICEDSTTGDTNGTQTEKKKNCFLRIFSRIKKILDRHPAPEKTQGMENVENPDRLQTGLNKTTTKASICEDSTTGDTNGTQTEKKKNCFLRIFSRIKKILDRHPAPEKTQGMENVENPDRLQTGLNKTTTKASICEDSTTGDTNGTQTEKKKNCFLRIFSRIKKILDRHPAPEKTQGMENVENPDRLQSHVMITGRRIKYNTWLGSLCEPAAAQMVPTTSSSDANGTQTEKKKSKKNCFLHFFSKIRRPDDKD